MSSRASQPAENFDSTAKLMLEALAKASAELEKSVTIFTEQLLSFNESLQKQLEEELRNVNHRLEGCVQTNLEELEHNKEMMMKRLHDAERAEVESILATGRQVRATLKAHAQQAEKKIEGFIEAQMNELKEYLKEPEAEVKSTAESAVLALEGFLKNSSESIRSSQGTTKRTMSDKLKELERALNEEMARSRATISSTLDHCQNELRTKADAVTEDIERVSSDATRELEHKAGDGLTSIGRAEDKGKESLDQVSDSWKSKIQDLCDSFDTSLLNLSTVLRETYETKLSTVGDQAKGEITELSSQAHEEISATRNELEVVLKELEREYLEQFDSVLRKLETIVNEHSNDKRNNGIARQHKAQKLRDQMQTHLKRWGAGLIDSVKDAADQLENEFLRSTDGFHQRVESARAAAIELLERESRLMEKDLERTMKEFHKEIVELESQLAQIEKAGQDAALTVIAYRKAMLSFGTE
jgi:hypothetical protein